MARIIVSNIPSTLRERELDDIFYKFGRIESIEIRGARINESSRRRTAYAYVQFRDWQDAADAAKSRNGYEIDGQPITVEVDAEYGDYGGGYGKGGGSGSPSAYYDNMGMSEKYYRVVVTNLPRGASWQDLKDKMRDAGECRFTEVTRDGVGVAGFAGQSDVERAVRTLDDTEMKSHFGDTSIIRVEEFTDEKHGETLGHIGKGKGFGKGKGKGYGWGKGGWGGKGYSSWGGKGGYGDWGAAPPPSGGSYDDPYSGGRSPRGRDSRRRSPSYGEREAVHGRLLCPFRVGALVVPQLRLRSCCKNIKQMWSIKPSRYYSVIPDMLGVHEDDASANDLQALRAGVVDLEKKGSLVVQYTEALTTSLVVEGSSMPSYDVKMIKQRLNTVTTLLEAMQSADRQRRRRHGKRFSFRQRPIPDDEWEAHRATESTATTAGPSPASTSVYPSSANVIGSRDGGVFDVEVNSSSEVYTLQDLTNCAVRFNTSSSTAPVQHLPAAIYIHGVRNSFIAVTHEAPSPGTPVGPVILCYDCHDSVIQLSGCYARQLRIHTSDGMVIYANASATPIIEDCTRIAMGGSFDISPSSITVADFSYLQVDGVSPNWRPIPDKVAVRRHVWDGTSPLSEVIGLFE
ncbi:Serine/arginine-rich splicing factor 1 [Perkinsus olseni]|uniref:Serine/arginine-rich splicing factor 1 n=1 Tax=Perkinsus olseni TaxID=32597 RepID=A0A7J6PHR1_PEROL|nr:Serine/arginine-rich splicing factor 1 [Perkinsus olseni]